MKTNKKLSVVEIFQLTQGLNLRIKEIQKHIEECNKLNMPELANKWERDLIEANAANEALNNCFDITLAK